MNQENRSRVVRAGAFVAGLLLSTMAWTAPPPPVTFNVNDNRDTAALIPGNGQCVTADGTCTLRAAVMQSNHYIVPVQINLPAGVYTLGAPKGSDGDDTGDLNLVSILNSPVLSIIGAGAASTIIDGNMTDGVFYIESDRTVYISGVTVRNGKTSSSGGGIYNFGNLTLSDSTLLANSAYFGGALENQGTAVVTRVAFNANAANWGGGIYNQGSLSVSESTFSANTGDNGAGLATFSMTPAVFDLTTFSGNKVTAYGGAIYSGGVLTLDHSSLTGNEAVHDGGGIYNTSGTLQIIRSTIASGKAAQGGGVFNSGSLFVINSTFSQNTSTGFGGAIGNLGTGNVYNSTIAFNTAGFGTGIAGFGGGIYNNPAGTFNVRNTIVAANYSPSIGFYDDCNGTLSSYGINRFVAGATAYCTVVQVGSGNHNGLVSFLELGQLKDNRGPTRTIALLPISNTDVIDHGESCLGPGGAGDLLTTDQRDRPRVVGTSCDIGAFEYDPGDLFFNGFQ